MIVLKLLGWILIIPEENGYFWNITAWMITYVLLYFDYTLTTLLILYYYTLYYYNFEIVWNIKDKKKLFFMSCLYSRKSFFKSGDYKTYWFIKVSHQEFSHFCLSLLLMCDYFVSKICFHFHRKRTYKN